MFWLHRISVWYSKLSRYWPRLLTGPDPPCRCRPIRFQAAPWAPVPFSHTAGSGSPRSAARRWGGTGRSHRSSGSWRLHRGRGGDRLAWGSGGQRPGGAPSVHCTVPAGSNRNTRSSFCMCVNKNNKNNNHKIIQMASVLETPTCALMSAPSRTRLSTREM